MSHKRDEHILQPLVVVVVERREQSLRISGHLVEESCQLTLAKRRWQLLLDIVKGRQTELLAVHPGLLLIFVAQVLESEVHHEVVDTGSEDVGQEVFIGGVDIHHIHVSSNALGHHVVDMKLLGGGDDVLHKVAHHRRVKTTVGRELREEIYRTDAVAPTLEHGVADDAGVELALVAA